MSTTIYFSRSFHEEDEEVFEAVLEAFENPEIEQRFDLDLIDSEQPTGDQLAERIESDIDRSDVVVCVFTRRHSIEEDGWVPPAYVTSEAGYAIGKGKTLIVLVEDGIDRSELGLVDAHNLQFLTFDREDAGSIGLNRDIRELVRSQLNADRLATNPSHRYARYRVYQTIYPNGYALTHYKVSVKVLRNEPISHNFAIIPAEEDVELPTSAELMGIGDEHPVPYPDEPFISFASDADGVEAEPLDSDEPYKRSINIHFPAVEESYDYQWMWGTHGAFNPDREYESLRLRLRDRAVDRVDVMLRLHSSLERPHEPRMDQLGSGMRLEERNDDSLLPYYESGRSTQEPVEHTPVYDCYWFTVTPVRPATDLLFMM